MAATTTKTSSKTMDSKTITAKNIMYFCIETICGHESGLFKLASANQIPLQLKTLTTTTDRGKILLKNFIMMATTSYLNKCYRSLILKDDPHVTEKFHGMSQPLGHSEICLLNILAQLIITIHSTVNRKDFDVSSYENYMKVFNERITANVSISLIHKLISHECTGVDILSCDPDEPLFSLKDHPDNKSKPAPKEHDHSHDCDCGDTHDHTCVERSKIE